MAGVYFQGNAPVCGMSVFSGDFATTVYYWPETIGWGPAFAGRPAFPLLAPAVVTGSASNVTETAAVLSGTVNPNGFVTTVFFEYGPTTNYGNSVVVPLSPSNGTSVQAVTGALAGLLTGTVYYYRLTASNDWTDAYGAGATFTTPSWVTFDAEGGAVSPPAKLATYAAVYGELPTPVRSGYTFAGWWTLAGGTGDVVTAASVVTAGNDHTLYAGWTANSYTVTFDPESGAVSPVSKTVTYNAAYGTLPAPSRIGYTSAGWWTGPGGTGAEVTEASIVAISADQTLYARWMANSYTVTFDPEGGAVSPASKTVTYDAVYGTLTTPTREGYVFTGWWTGAGGTGAEVAAATLVTTSSDQTLYARWTADSYTATFDAAGGAVSPASKTIGYAQTYGALPEPVRTGYTFAGWFSGANGSGSLVTASTAMTTGSGHTLYAFWTGVITATAGAGGSIIPCGVIPVAYAGDTNVVIQPSSHYHIADVLVDGATVGPTNGYLFANVTSNQTIHASFAIDRHTLTVISDHGGARPGTQTAVYGTVLSLQVTNSPVVNGATQFVCTGASVFGNEFVQSSPTNVVMTLTNNASLTWEWFTRYRVVVLANGSGSVSGGGWYDAGNEVTLIATPNQGNRFAGWSDGVQSTNRVVVVPEGGYAVTATFEPIPQDLIRLRKSVYSVAENVDVARVTVERVNAAQCTATVSFEALDITALVGDDYFAGPYTIFWDNGENGTKTIYVDILDDDAYEGNESFSIQLVDATGAAMGDPNTALVTIVDDDSAPSSVPRFSGTLDFGEVATNAVSVRTVEVWNDGNQPLSVTNVWVPSGFSVTQQVFTVPAGEAVALSVWFAPTELVGYGGLLTLGCNATSGTVSLAVSGTGVVPVPPAGIRTITALTAVIAVDVPEGAEMLGVEDRLSQGLIPVSISDGGIWDSVNRKVKWFFNEPGQVRDRALQYRVSAYGNVVTGVVNFGSGDRTITGDTAFASGGDPGLLHPADDNGDWRVVLNEVSSSVSRWKNGLDGQKTPVVVRGITLYLQGEFYAYDAQVSAEAKRWIPMIDPQSMGGDVLALRMGPLSEPQAGAVRSVLATNVTITVTPETGTTAWGMEESVPEGVTVAGISSDGTWDANHRRIKWAFFDGDARSLSYSFAGIAGTNVTVAGTVSFDGSEDPVTGASVVAVPLSFMTWADRRGLSGEPEAIFNAMNDDFGQPNGLVYVFGSNLSAGDRLLDICWLAGVPFIETPIRDPSTLTFVDVSVEWASDLAVAGWSSGLVPAADQSGVPPNRCRWVPLSVPDNAFYRLRAVLK